jgi:hypothetical protein
MRLILSLMFFLMASVTVTGFIIGIGIAVPTLDITQLDVFGWVVAAGFLTAAPVSYWVAGKVLRADPARQGHS